MEQQIQNLRDEIHELKIKLEGIEDLLRENLEESKSAGISARNMDRHIAFVEGIWSRIRNPFWNALEYVSGGMKVAGKDRTVHKLQEG